MNPDATSWMLDCQRGHSRPSLGDRRAGTPHPATESAIERMIREAKAEAWEQGWDAHVAEQWKYGDAQDRTNPYGGPR